MLFMSSRHHDIIIAHVFSQCQLFIIGNFPLIDKCFIIAEIYIIFIYFKNEISFYVYIRTLRRRSMHAFLKINYLYTIIK